MHSIPSHLLESSDTPWYVRAILAALLVGAVAAFLLWRYPQLSSLVL
ncbi:hypothetical protein [Haloglomus salinum]|nr:hypothetical protein [Haloglomus salinum]